MEKAYAVSSQNLVKEKNSAHSSVWWKDQKVIIFLVIIILALKSRKSSTISELAESWYICDYLKRVLGLGILGYMTSKKQKWPKAPNSKKQERR